MAEKKPEDTVTAADAAAALRSCGYSQSDLDTYTAAFRYTAPWSGNRPGQSAQEQLMRIALPECPFRLDRRGLLCPESSTVSGGEITSSYCPMHESRVREHILNVLAEADVPVQHCGSIAAKTMAAIDAAYVRERGRIHSMRLRLMYEQEAADRRRRHAMGRFSPPLRDAAVDVQEYYEDSGSDSDTPRRCRVPSCRKHAVGGRDTHCPEHTLECEEDYFAHMHAFSMRWGAIMLESMLAGQPLIERLLQRDPGLFV